MKKPSPVHTETVCSVCGLDWDRHGDKPTPETCIELLRHDLAVEKQRTAPLQPSTYPLPYPVPYPVAPRPYVPNPYPWRPQPGPIWYTTIGAGTTAGLPQINATAASPAKAVWQHNQGGIYQ